MSRTDIAAPAKAGSAVRHDSLGFIDPEYSLQVTGSFTLSQLSNKAMGSAYCREMLQEYKDLLGSAWQVADAEMVTARQGEAGRETAALRAKRSRISKGQARIAVPIEQLMEYLDAQGKYATALIMAQALRGDQEALKVLRRTDSTLREYVEFFAILAELHDIELARAEYLQQAEAEPSCRLQAVCSVPEFIKPPEQVLRGAVSISAPPAVPTDITEMGYAVGCVA